IPGHFDQHGECDQGNEGLRQSNPRSRQVTAEAEAEEACDQHERLEVREHANLGTHPANQQQLHEEAEEADDAERNEIVLVDALWIEEAYAIEHRVPPRPAREVDEAECPIRRENREIDQQERWNVLHGLGEDFTCWHSSPRSARNANTYPYSS